MQYSAASHNCDLFFIFLFRPFDICFVLNPVRARRQRKVQSSTSNDNPRGQYQSVIVDINSKLLIVLSTECNKIGRFIVPH